MTELPVVCLETRLAHKALPARMKNTGRNDARGLVELMRAGCYGEAWVRGASAHSVRSLLLGRGLLVQIKRAIEDTLSLDHHRR